MTTKLKVIPSNYRQLKSDEMFKLGDLFRWYKSDSDKDIIYKFSYAHSARSLLVSDWPHWNFYRRVRSLVKNMKQKKQLIYEAIKELNGNWAIKTQYRGKYYTAAETYYIPGRLDAKEMAETIAALLNHKERVNNSPRLHQYGFFNYCINCGLAVEDSENINCTPSLKQVKFGY